MPKAFHGSEKDLAIRRRLLSSLRRYNATNQALELLNKEQLSFLCAIIGIKRSKKTTRDELTASIMAFKEGVMTEKIPRCNIVINEEAEEMIMLLEQALKVFNDSHEIKYSPYRLSVFDDLPFDFDDGVSFSENGEREISGTVGVTYNRCFIKRSKYAPLPSDPLLPDELYLGLRLRVGDEVNVVVKNVGVYDVVFEVKTVNGEAPNKNRKNEFVQIERIKPKNVVNFDRDNNPLGVLLNKLTSFKLGQNLGLISKDGCDLTNEMRYIADVLKDKYKVFYLNFKNCLENRFEPETTYSLFDKTDEMRFSSLCDAVEKAKRDFINGENVVFVIDSINDVMKLIAKFSERNTRHIKLEATSFLQDILLLSRQSMWSGSISIILSMQASELEDASRGLFSSKELEELIRKYLNSAILFDSTLESFGVYPPINLLKSGNDKGKEREYVGAFRKIIRSGNYLVETEKAIKALTQRDSE